MSPFPAPRLRAVLSTTLALAVLAMPFWWHYPHFLEDYPYYYAAARLFWQGRNPYDIEVYRAGLAAAVGNIPGLGAVACPIPPWAFLALGPLALLPFPASYLLWNGLLWLALVLVWALAAAFLRLPRAGAGALLLAAVLATFPGVVDSVHYHRLAILGLAWFLSGASLWARGRRGWACGCWGGLAVFPQWFPFLFGFLFLAGRRREALGTLWLAGLSLLPYALGLQPWTQWGQWLQGMGAHVDMNVFMDNQSLAVCLYKLSHFWLFRHALLPTFPPTQAFRVLQTTLYLASWAAVWALARRAGELPGRLALALAAALFGSVYSHAGDQLWLAPALLVLCRVWQDETGRPVWPLLLPLLPLNLALVPDYRVPMRLLKQWWEVSGFWSLDYLMFAVVAWRVSRAFRKPRDGAAAGLN